MGPLVVAASPKVTLSPVEKERLAPLPVPAVLVCQLAAVVSQAVPAALLLQIRSHAPPTTVT